MSEARAASRYAKAVLDLALEQKKAGDVEKDMQRLLDTLASSESLGEVLTSPVLKASDKASALKALFGDASKLTGQLFSLLAENKRIGMLDEVARQYIAQYEEIKGQDVAHVTTAVPLTPALEKKVLGQLQAITGKEVALEQTVDPELIGGFVLRVGDLEYNASLAHKLGNLKRELVQK